MLPTKSDFVHETAFGNWFLQSNIWKRFVLRVAIKNLRKLQNDVVPKSPTIVDIGCGHGASFSIIRRTFRPGKIIGIDIYAQALSCAQRRIKKENIQAELIHTDCTHIPLSSNSVDIVLCHQTLHHLTRQRETLQEIIRILKPGGTLLLAESTKKYIHSWLIRLFFRHPMEAQKTAGEYITLLRETGFKFTNKHIAYPYAWWSRTKDFGLLEFIGYRPKRTINDETLINIVATKPNL